MSEFQFTSGFWSWWIAIITIANILACWWLISWATKRRAGEAAQGDVTGHTWDEDLEEYNNPLPRWWLWLFHITLVFGLMYLVLYPGLGAYRGLLGWTGVKQYQEQVEAAEQKYGPLYARYAQQPIPRLAANDDALKTGRRLFVNNCATCHGTDAGGAPGHGFPSLRDGAWLYGSGPEAIKDSILNGRQGQMPPLGAAVGGSEGAEQVAHYVLSLGERPHDQAGAAAGKAKFGVCAGCHGMDGKGSVANNLPGIGAPDLTDGFWLYGGSVRAIVTSIMEGRQGNMPAHEELLGEDRVHLLAAYVYSLSTNARSE